MNKELICIMDMPSEIRKILKEDLGIDPPVKDNTYHAINEAHCYYQLAEYPHSVYSNLAREIFVPCFHKRMFVEIPDGLSEQIEDALRAPVPKKKLIISSTPLGAGRWAQHGMSHETDALNYFIMPSKPFLICPHVPGWPHFDL